MVVFVCAYLAAAAVALWYMRRHWGAWLGAADVAFDVVLSLLWPLAAAVAAASWAVGAVRRWAYSGDGEAA